MAAKHKPSVLKPGERVKLKVKKGDKVVVLTGSDKGKTGEILRVKTQDMRVVVQGVNLVTKHKRATPMSPGGIERIEAPIHVSNVAHIDPKDGKPTRVGYRMEGETKLLVARRSGETIKRQEG